MSREQSFKTKAVKTVSALWDSLNYLIWPAVCLNCKTSISEKDKYLCDTCWQGLLECTSGDYCPGCGKNVSRFAVINNKCHNCQNINFQFDRIARCGIYAAVLRQLILKFKNDRTELDLLFSNLLKASLESSGFYDDIELFIPVPLHWTKQLKRGYNQSALAAEKIKHPVVKINTDLVRVRATKTQASMSTPNQRLANVSNAFTVRKNHIFKNKNICLIDDIKTTGATLNECAKILKRQGAAKVYALVIAVADQKDILKD
jgi:competence protein ComFC